MDLWVVAAAAGAGYLAKYWNRISKNEDSSCHLSSEDLYFENPASPSCRFPLPKHTRRDESGKDVSLDRRTSDLSAPDGHLAGEVASNRGLNSENVRRIRNYNKNDVLSISNLAVSLSPYDDNFNDVEDGNEKNSDIVGNHGFSVPDSSAEVVRIQNSSGHRTFLRSKNLSGHISSRPLSSLESCFMAQLYKEHAEMEEYVFSSPSSPSTATRSFLVSNGSRIINREYDNSLSSSTGSKQQKVHKAAGQVKDDCVLGIPSLSKFRSLNDSKKVKFNAVDGTGRKLSESLFSRKLIQSESDATFLFSLGISFGMIVSIMINKREVDKLRERLKQSENLVQDLQEELEMKDSLTVKELQNENYGSQSQDTCDHSFNDKELHEFSPEKHMDNSPRNDCQESYDQKVEQSSESMSKIEAELEAELERLGLDMNASSLERKLSELIEIDPEFVADFAQGELQTDMVNGKDFIHSKSNDDAIDATPLPGNYAVLPHELSLRLHEVIQSQLEERVKELEIALERSERKLRLMESEHQDYSQKPSSFARENQITDEDYCDPMSQPLILNLSGEALDAYNEAYEELIKINDSEENSPYEIHDGDHKEGSNSYDWHALGVQYDDNDSPVNEVNMLEGKSSRISELNGNGDDSCGFDIEEEQQLIRQIIERTKKGSPVFKNAQRILYSMDEDEH